MKRDGVKIKAKNNVKGWAKRFAAKVVRHNGKAAIKSERA
jgi:hypothetical protein